MLTAAVLLAATPKSPSPEVGQRLIGRALVEGEAYARLAELTDSIGPRLSGTPGAEAAVQWALAKLKQDGVKAWLEPVKVPRWERGSVARVELLAQPGFRAQPLTVLALGGSVGTPPEGVTAEVLEVGSFEELQAAGEKAKGKVVFFNHAMAESKDYGKFAALRSRGAAEAGRAGAVAMLVRSLATASLRSPHTGSTVYVEGVPQVPAAALSVEDAELLHRAVAAGTARVRLTLDCRSLPDADSHNVVAEVRGREKPEEVVLLGAHLDSWDVGTGAHDDGAGVVMVMDALRLLAQQRPAPRRTVRVVLFMNEENGLRGARAYAEKHAAELPRHVAALEMDSGGGRPLGVAVTAGEGGEVLVRQWLKPLRQVGAGVFLPGDAGGADIGPMRPAGVPFVSVRVDSSRYFDVHHSEADTLDKVDPVALAQSTAALTWVAYALGESPEVLPRQPPPPAATREGASGRH
ncbi:MAG: M20/M25/M40 family metallo-hydrolase [Myxococcaceae bacterium]|nr:M20/M25/M40 family metallo-hydrolase [Myxococcaceae bacterium]